MDTTDRLDSNVPARYPTDATGMPARIATAHELAVATPDASTVTPQVLMRGLSRHWWRITLVWLVLGIPLGCAIYALVKPTYEAMSLLRVEPQTEQIYNLNSSQTTMRDVKPYLLTQVELIKSNSVLDSALAHAGDQQAADDPRFG